MNAKYPNGRSIWVNVVKHWTKMYRIPGLGILPGKRMEWALSGGRTVHRALLDTIHIPGVILIPGWRNWGSERLSHLPKCPSAEVKCPLHWFMSPFALKGVPLITIPHMVIWAICSRYSAQSRCSVLRVAGFTDSKRRAKRRAHCCCKPRYISLPGPITLYMENEIDDSASFLNFGMASNIYEIVRSLSGWKPSQKPTISLPFLLVITESFRCLPKITDLKTSTTNSLPSSTSAISGTEKMHRPSGFKEKNGSTYPCVSVCECKCGGQGEDRSGGWESQIFLPGHIVY